MNQRLSRKDIKRDEFVEGLEHSVDYAREHLRLIGMIIVGILAVAGAVWGIWAWRQSRLLAANDALAAAIRIYDAPIDAKAPKPDDADAPSFATEDARRQKAEEAFTKLAQERGGTGAGATANLYLAAMAVERGQSERARDLWQQYLKSGEKKGMLAGAVELDLVRLERSQGKADQAAQELRHMLEDPDRAAPQDAILYELAVTLQAQGKADEARANFQRIVDEFPRSPYRSDAQRQVAGGGAAPGLNLSPQ